MKRPRNLELLVYRVMYPTELLYAYYSGESEDDSLKEAFRLYNNGLNYFATPETKDYDGFRDFLRRNAELFGEGYRRLEQMTNEEIDYVFGRIVEERIESFIGSLNTKT